MLEGTDLMSAYQSISSPQMDIDARPATPAEETKPQTLPAQSFENDQKMMTLVAELKKKKAETSPVEPSYFDKLFGKKKELLKLLQLALIVTLGISLHFLIDHYLNKYLADNEMSFERQLFIRLLYPLSIVFLLWNLRVFIK